MSGEMEKPLVIGKAAKPRCFRNLDIRNMDDVTDRVGMVNGFQWQNENAKPACFVVLE